MKKVLALLLALAMVLALGACSSTPAPQDDSTSQSTPSTSDSVKVDDSTPVEPAAEVNWDTNKKDEIVLSVMNNYYTSGWKKMAEEYTKLHPETTVTVDIVADNDTYLQKFATWFGADDLMDASDIVHINFGGNVGGADNMMLKGQAYDFTDILDTVNPYSGTTVRSYQEEDALSIFTTEHGVYGLPFDHVGVALMVNTDMLKANDLQVPTTMEELLHCCEVLKAAGVETPFLSTAEGEYLVDAMGDAALRDTYGDFLYQTTDGGYDEKTMSANASYKYDANDLMCDNGIKFSGERTAIYIKDNGIQTDKSKSIWAEFAKFGPYLNENFLASASTEVLSSFEMQNGAFLCSGSWNVGVLNKDLQDMGDDAFAWETIPFPSYATKPEGWASGELRSLYSVGNAMGILKTHGEDEDHLNRVVDFYLYVYSPVGCATMFQETLGDGYFVQGNPAIKGVELPADITAKLNGFIQEAPLRSDLKDTYGRNCYMSEDKGTYLEAFNKLCKGEYDAAQFLEAIEPLVTKKVDDNITNNGWDLDPATKDEVK